MGNLQGVMGARTNEVSISDCGGTLSRCSCRDPQCGCRNSSAVEDFTCVISRDTWLREVTPLLAPCQNTTVVTMFGNFKQRIVNCSVDNILSKPLNPTDSSVQCVLPPIWDQKCHGSATQLRVASEHKLSDHHLNVYRYSATKLGVIDITDAFDKSPPSGLFTGGRQTRDPLILHGTEELRHLLTLASSGSIAAVKSIVCQFQMCPSIMPAYISYNVFYISFSAD